MHKIMQETKLQQLNQIILSIKLYLRYPILLLLLQIMEGHGMFHSRPKTNEEQGSGNLQKLQILTMMLMRLVME